YLVLYFRTSRNVSSEQIDPGIVAYGRNLTFMTFLTYIAPYVDRLIVAGVAGFEGLAIYSIAMAITLNLSVNGQLISILLLPKLSRESPYHEQRIKKLFWWVCLLILFGIGIVILAIPWVISFLFADKYVASIPYAQIGAVYLAFFIPATILRTYFQGRKKTKILYAYNLSIGIINLVLLGILAPLFGILGAVISKVLLGFFGFVFLVVSFYMSETPVLNKNK
ncbi:MAG TPA: hypothetical protein VI612_00290, partial [Candidatus Nanoarchaeia archaeon]|nr:hypothetical protein [Candidatus Nanoarchaeia archaeon]